MCKCYKYFCAKHECHFASICGLLQYNSNNIINKFHLIRNTKYNVSHRKKIVGEILIIWCNQVEVMHETKVMEGGNNLSCFNVVKKPFVFIGSYILCDIFFFQSIFYATEIERILISIKLRCSCFQLKDTLSLRFISECA